MLCAFSVGHPVACEGLVLKLSVVICTKNRSESLRRTLEDLERVDRHEVHFEILVVDNGSTDDTQDVVESFSALLPVRYLHHAAVGKGAALNRALEENHLGEVIAVLDDDMVPAHDWFHAVLDTCRRNPDYDFFGGRIYPIYPQEDLPGWIHTGSVRRWAFSCIDKGEQDQPMSQGEWPCGNHFWFRKSIPDAGLRFHNLWATEPEFGLRLAAMGYQGLWSGSAVAGHRIQSALLSVENLRKRAALLGRSLPHVRLPFDRTEREAIFRREHPRLWTIWNAFSLARWSCLYAGSLVTASRDARIGRQLTAILGIAKSTESLRIALWHGLDKTKTGD